ncbi:MAG TPA: glycosyltransferase [Flavisolibacter sp.]|nr:glycosyltransferase [Flavisolibacter sp.]
MPTAVLDLDLTKLPSEIDGLKAYDRAFILLRYKGRPVGKIMVPVTNGSLIIENYYPGFINAVEPELKTAWLHDHLQWDETDTIDFTPPKATIAICTRDRTDDLKRCLESLMLLPDDGQEIIVIDNCPSTEETKHLVESYPSVRYICENNKGLDFARNRALKEAQQEIIAFTDDDATPDPMWLRSLLRNFGNPLVMCVTGMTMPLELETEGQEAFEDYSPFGKGFKRKVHTHTSGNPLSTGQVGAGANMALRKSVQHLVGYFDVALDAGTPTQSGGDHEFFSRILLAGYQIVYEPDAVSWHRHRRTMEETRKAIKGYGIGVYAYWTRLLVEEGELGVLKLPYGWFIYTQFPNVIKTILRRPGRKPFNLLLAELHGCILGPWKYFASKRHVKRKRKTA